MKAKTGKVQDERVTMKNLIIGFGCLSFALSAGAADYWVAQGGTGDGRSSGSPSGNLVNVVNNLATAAGDVVHIGPGTYEISTGLSVQSGVSLVGTSGNPQDTIVKRIVSGDNDRVAYLRTPKDAAIPTRLENLTFTGGYTIYQGGGVGAVEECSYIASNCVVSCSKASYAGGGAMGGTWYDSTFRECEVFKYTGGNALLGGRTYASIYDMSGGGAYGGTYYRCRFENNKSAYGGAGLGGGGVGPAYRNAKTNKGEPVSLDRPDLVARAYDCTFVGNESGHGSAAFSFANESLFLSGCTFVSNKTVKTVCVTNLSDTCGTVYFGTLTNCTLAANSAGNGAGLFNCIATNCTVRGNTASMYGGGAYRGLLSGCWVESNSALGGGGLFNGTAVGCTFTNNTATAALGGGVAGWALRETELGSDPSATASVTDCTIVGNFAAYGGGGVYRAYVTNSTIVANRETSSSSSSWHGGAGVNNSVLVDCRVLNNGGSVNFGGGFLRGSALRCLVAGNRANYGGAGCIFTVFRDSILSNNTAVGSQGTACYNCTTYNCIVVDNKFEGSKNGRGVLCRGYHQGDLIYRNGYLSGGVLAAEAGNHDIVAVNCTIVDNVGNDPKGAQCGAAGGAYTNCVFAGNGTDMHSGVPVAVNCVWKDDRGSSPPSTMVDCQANVDPRFAGARGTFSPYEIRSSSPCRDKGLLQDWMTDDAKDLKGDPRVRFGKVDVGAFECFSIPGVSVFVR